MLESAAFIDNSQNEFVNWMIELVQTFPTNIERYKNGGKFDVEKAAQRSFSIQRLVTNTPVSVDEKELNIFYDPLHDLKVVLS